MAKAKREEETVDIPKKAADAKMRLVMVVEYERSVDTQDIEEVIDAGRSYGRVVMARLERLMPVVEDLV